MGVKRCIYSSDILVDWLTNFKFVSVIKMSNLIPNHFSSGVKYLDVIKAYVDGTVNG